MTFSGQACATKHYCHKKMAMSAGLEEKSRAILALQLEIRLVCVNKTQDFNQKSLTLFEW